MTVTMRTGPPGPKTPTPASAADRPLPDDDSIAAMGVDELREVFAQLETARRQLEHSLARVVGRLDEVGAHRADGHASVTGLLRVARWSNAECRRIRQVARLLDAEPEVAAASSSGDVGVAQLAELARARANPRCGDRLGEVVPVLLDHARRLPHREFRSVVRRWESLADADGADRTAEATHEARDAQVVEVGDEIVVKANGATGPGSVIREVFERFVAAEWDHDWSVTKEAFGDDASVALMPRSAAQRRSDALAKIFARAAAVDGDARVAEPLVDLVIDVHTLDAFVHGANTLSTPAPAPRRRRCETVDGVPVRPSDVAAAMWWGQVRKVVVDDAGVVIAMGRRQRLFTGAARDAVMLQATRCVAAGCDVPLRRCQADHLRDWANGGDTDPSNGAPLCGRHNRLKNTGFRIARDPDGHWHTHRPDGTEIT